MNQNNLKKITDLLIYGDGKFLVVEDGEPAFVVMGIEEYKKIKELNSLSEREILDRINRDIESWKGFSEEEDEFDDEGFDPEEFEKETLGDYHPGEEKDDEITIENLENADIKKEENSEDRFKVDGIEGIPF